MAEIPRPEAAIRAQMASPPSAINIRDSLNILAVKSFVLTKLTTAHNLPSTSHSGPEAGTRTTTEREETRYATRSLGRRPPTSRSTARKRRADLGDRTGSNIDSIRAFGCKFGPTARGCGNAAGTLQQRPWRRSPGQVDQGPTEGAPPTRS